MTVTAGGVRQSLRLTPTHPQGRLVFQAPFAGTYRAVLSVTTWFANGAIRNGQGEGDLVVSGPCAFELYIMNPNVEPMGLSLRQLRR